MYLGSIIIVTIIVVTIYLYWQTKQSSFGITYVSRSYIGSVINDAKFFQQMSKADLIARDAKNIED